MADIIDLANDMAELNLAIAEVQARGKSGPEYHPDFNGADCIDCLEPIPSARLAMSKVRCVECQGALERRGRR